MVYLTDPCKRKKANIVSAFSPFDQINPVEDLPPVQIVQRDLLNPEQHADPDRYKRLLDRLANSSDSICQFNFESYLSYLSWFGNLCSFGSCPDPNVYFYHLLLG